MTPIESAVKNRIGSSCMASSAGALRSFSHAAIKTHKLVNRGFLRADLPDLRFGSWVG